MNLLAVGWDFRTAPLELRERLSVPEPRLPAVLSELISRCGGEAVVLSTCNRLEVYLADSAADAAAVTGLIAAEAAPLAYERRGADAVRHLFRVGAGLESLVLGEGQIAGQVKRAYEAAAEHAAAGPCLHALFQHARSAARRVRRETGIGHGRASVSSVAVDFVRGVFDHFADKTVLVIGAGKMGRLALSQLRGLGVAEVLVANRSADRAKKLADTCGGSPVRWEGLDDAVGRSDIVISSTSAANPVMSAERFAQVRRNRPGTPLVILDIAVPRDFDPAIHDGDRVFLFNIDDLQRVRDRTLAERRKQVAPAESIIEQEAARFLAGWARRRNGAVIARLTADFESKRRAVVADLLHRLDGRVNNDDKRAVEGAFRLLQNQFLHGPISALGNETREGSGTHLLDALRRLFGLKE